jgi:hypothetical protein
VIAGNDRGGGRRRRRGDEEGAGAGRGGARGPGVVRVNLPQARRRLPPGELPRLFAVVQAVRFS